jgi:hypothetical protein
MGLILGRRGRFGRRGGRSEFNLSCVCLVAGFRANVMFRDIGTAEAVLGPVDKLPTPFEIPW